MWTSVGLNFPPIFQVWKWKERRSREQVCIFSSAIPLVLSFYCLFPLFFTFLHPFFFSYTSFHIHFLCFLPCLYLSLTSCVFFLGSFRFCNLPFLWVFSFVNFLVSCLLLCIICEKQKTFTSLGSIIYVRHDNLLQAADSPSTMLLILLACKVWIRNSWKHERTRTAFYASLCNIIFGQTDIATIWTWVTLVPKNPSKWSCCVFI